MSQDSMMYVELNIMFQDCSVKFDTVQHLAGRSPVFFLMFSKFISFQDYDFINFCDLESKFCGYLFMPDPFKLTDIQKVATESFILNLISTEMIIAETIDDKVEFLYLIAHKSMNSPMGTFLGQSPFGIFQFRYEEL